MKTTKTNTAAKITPKKHDSARRSNNTNKRTASNNANDAQAKVTAKPEPSATAIAYQTPNYTLGQLTAGTNNNNDSTNAGNTIIEVNSDDEILDSTERVNYSYTKTDPTFD